MIRHNTSFVKLGSNYRIADKTDYSLAIYDPILEPKIIINFPSHVNDLVLDKPNLFDVELDRVHSRLSNNYVNIYFSNPRMIVKTERFAILAMIKLGNNISIEDQKIFFEFADKMLELLQLKLSNLKMYSRISAAYNFIPMLPEPTWKDKAKVLLKRIFTLQHIELPKSRPSKNIFYPDMGNINFDIIVKHAYNQLFSQYSMDYTMKLTNVNGFIVFKVIDINNRIENEVQVIVEN